MVHIEVDHISKYFGDRVILDKICFFLGNGQKAGLVGRNGQGKTMLMNIITSLEKCDGGICSVSGRIAYLAQHDPASTGSVMDFLSLAGKDEYQFLAVGRTHQSPGFAFPGGCGKCAERLPRNTAFCLS